MLPPERLPRADDDPRQLVEHLLQPAGQTHESQAVGHLQAQTQGRPG